MKDKMSWKDMTDCDIFNYINNYHNGETITEFQRSASGCYRIAHERGLIDFFIDKEALIRKKAPNGYLKDMKDEQLVTYITNHYQGLTLAKFAKSKSHLYEQICKRQLIDLLVDKGILVREQKSARRWKDMSDCDIFNYINNSHNDETLTELHQKDSKCYEQILERGLIDLLVEKGVLIRERMKKNVWKEMSDCDIFNYVNNCHNGEAITDFQKSKDNGCYAQVRERGLIDLFVDKGVLVRKQQVSGYWKDMSDKQLIDYVKKNYNGKVITELEDLNGSLCGMARERDLINTLVEQGILIRERKPARYWKDMSDCDLFNYVNNYYQGYSITDLENLNSTLCGKIREKKLANFLVEQGVLIRKKSDKKEMLTKIFEEYVKQNGG